MKKPELIKLIAPSIYPCGTVHKRGLFRCSCGKEFETNFSAVKSGNTKSCGCLKILTTIRRSTKHGLSNSPLYKVYKNMVSRCTQPTYHTVYPYYGGCGIKVCNRWLKSINNFYKDMFPSYQPGLTLERKDPKKDYKPSNCIWADFFTQARNRGNTKWVTFKGETLCATIWSIRLNAPNYVVGVRLRKGWSVERAVTTPYPANKINKMVNPPSSSNP